MAEQKTPHWSRGLWFVQSSKNRRFHSGIGRSPYEAMYGRRMQVGISDMGIPKAKIDEITSEEDLMVVQGEPNEEVLPNEISSNIIAILDENSVLISENQSAAHTHQKKQAEKMLERSNCK